MKKLYNFLRPIAASACILSVPLSMHATNYYVSNNGSNSNNGTSISTPWQTISKVSGMTFSPGDSILFHCDDTFTGQLVISSSGSSSLPIVYGKYGTGALPYLAAQGSFASTIYALNKQYFELTNLKVSNFLTGNNINSSSGAQLRGIYLLNQDAGTLNHIYLTGMEVSNVNSEQVSGNSRYYGGVYFEVLGGTTPSKWNDLLIRNCNFHDISRTALSWNSSWEVRSSTSTFGQSLPNSYTDNWVPSTNIVIRSNTFQHVSGNGLIIRVATGALVETNYFNYCGEQISGNAAFCFNTDGTLFQYNEAENTIYNEGDTDARGIDADFRTKNTIIQYNYLHDNGKGGIVGTGGPEDGTAYERFNIGLVIRYNVLEDNLREGLVFSGNLYNATVHNNVVFGSSTISDVEIVNFHAWSVFPHDVSFYSNVFYVKGSGAKYVYGDVRNITFNHNLYSYTSVPQGLPVTGFNSFAHIAEDNFSVLANPLFNLPGGSSFGYKLEPGSPAFNVGRRGLSQPTLDYYNNTIGNIRNIGVDQTPGVSTTEYQVDINDVSAITKAGFTGLIGAEGNAIAINGVRFTMFGGILGTRDRGTAGEVTRDFAYNDGVGAGVGFRMEYLPAGTYTVNTWQYDPNFPGLVNVEFREMGLPATMTVKASGKSLTSSASTSFNITVEDGKDYELIVREASSEHRSRLNGVRITPVTSPARGSSNLSGPPVVTDDQLQKANELLQLFPNPSTSNFTVTQNITADGSKLQLIIRDIQGKPVYKTEEMVNKGIWRKQISTQFSNMVKGIYTVTVFVEGKEQTANMLVL